MLFLGIVRFFEAPNWMKPCREHAYRFVFGQQPMLSSPMGCPQFSPAYHPIRVRISMGQLEQLKWYPKHVPGLVNIEKTMENHHAFNWEPMGKPWENHGKMVIYMEHHHAING